jgi:hypothetical protein
LVRPGRLVVATAVVAAIAGCSGETDEAEESSPQPPPAAEVDELLGEVERARPGAALRDFVRAAARGDERRMWVRLSAPTKSRLGGSLTAFRRQAAPQLRRELAALGRRQEVILSETITPRFSVAAVGRGTRAYAAALRLDGGLWRVELGSAVRLEPLRPDPGETVERRTQLAAEVSAGAPIVEAGLWLDGRAFPSRGGGPTANALTMFGETRRLAPGAHNVIAFASTASSAGARAWTFRAGG